MISDDFRLFQNYPNPFNAQTTISYQLFKPSRVNINIFNIHGALVRSLINDYQTIGYYRIPWDGNNSNGIPVPSGTYLESVEKCRYFHFEQGEKPVSETFPI